MGCYISFAKEMRFLECLSSKSCRLLAQIVYWEKNMTIARITVAGAHVLLIAGTAYAADEAQPNVLEEVVVTAQKRADGEQSVPLSMTTFGSAALQEKSINTFFDYATKVPN